MADAPSLTRPRRRDAVATRATIIEHARLRFARANYDRVGLRDIAADAGVDAALLIRYFGSKEMLLETVLHEELNWTGLTEGDRGTFGMRIITRLMREGGEDRGLDYFMLLLRAATVPALAPRLREIVDDRLMRPFAAWLGGEDAILRAKQILTVLSGVAIQTWLSGNAALSAVQIDANIRTFGELVQNWVDGSAPPGLAIVDQAGTGDAPRCRLICSHPWATARSRS